MTTFAVKGGKTSTKQDNNNISICLGRGVGEGVIEYSMHYENYKDSIVTRYGRFRKCGIWADNAVFR